MSRPRTHEQRLLADASALLKRALRECDAPDTAAIEVLEAVAAAHGGWPLSEYREAFPATRYLDVERATVWGDKLLGLLKVGVVPLPLAVAALGQPALTSGEQRKAGAYYTDFRLAQHLAEQVELDFGPDDRVVDLAAGSGMLLTALAQRFAAAVGTADDFVSRNACAADLHPEALAASRASLATTCSSLQPLLELQPRLLVGDSLTRTAEEWEEIAPGGFRGVIGNPPWEKLKVTRHEVLTDAGVKRHYGALYDERPHPEYDAARARMVTYVQTLASQNQLQGKGEADLYKLFLELGARLLRPGGQLALLVPAGLIRSQGTYPLRRFVLDHAENLTVTVLENRASFFAIDTRFKFLALSGRIAADAACGPVRLRRAEGTGDGVAITGDVAIERGELAAVRPDLTIPEVRSPEEWALFCRLVRHGSSLDDDAWAHVYQRELDMTNDRQRFNTRKRGLPLVEGRMVHQHRVMAKAHISGTGRAAVWTPLAHGDAALRPQFWVEPGQLPDKVRQRIGRPRAGFCDVTGQTNERTLLAAVVPADVVCGNKVPTLTFDSCPLGAEVGALAWTALANSFAVDWAARRVVTTSMNYFLLRSLPLPRLTVSQIDEVVAAALALQAAEVAHEDPWDLAALRAQIDAVVAQAFGMTVADMALVFADFKLLDRGQASLPGERRSTVTRDLVLATLAVRSGQDPGEWGERLDHARRLGAVAYVPADYAVVTSKGGTVDCRAHIG